MAYACYLRKIKRWTAFLLTSASLLVMMCHTASITVSLVRSWESVSGDDTMHLTRVQFTNKTAVGVRCFLFVL